MPIGTGLGGALGALRGGRGTGAGGRMTSEDVAKSYEEAYKNSDIEFQKMAGTMDSFALDKALKSLQDEHEQIQERLADTSRYNIPVAKMDLQSNLWRQQLIQSLIDGK